MTAGGEDKVVRVFDVRTGKLAMQLPEFSSRIRTLVHEPLSKSLSVLGSSSFYSCSCFCSCSCSYSSSSSSPPLLLLLLGLSEGAAPLLSIRLDGADVPKRAPSMR